jgi:NADH-quinone oxidoreductase subunit J
MMLDINFVELRQGFLRYLPLGATVALLILCELVVVMWFSLKRGDVGMAAQAYPIPDVAEVTNTHAVGQILYTDFVYPFQVAGLILLVAMVGAIVLTLRHKPDSRRQSVASQHSRKRSQAVAVVKVGTGEGVE